MQAQYSQKDLLRESNELFAQGKYAEAMTGFAQLLSLEPTNLEYSYKYGATALYGDPSKRAEAIKYLRFAAGKAGVDPLAWYFLGRAYHLNYQFADAIAAYQKFADQAPKKEADIWQINQVIQTARNGQDLLSSIKDVTVLDKKKSDMREFFRLYDLTAIGGKILVTPEELLSPLDIKQNHRSLIHFRGTGTTVYFSSYGKDGKNGLDIYSAEVLPGGTYSAPKPLPGNINTPYDEDFPFLHPDGRTFYFSSKGHSSMGGYDVFKASFDSNSAVFGSPQNMDFAINTPDDDIFYIADSLNRLATFASGRSSKQGELHVYRVNVDMQPVHLTLVKGNFSNRISPAQRTVKVTVTDAATNKTVDVQYADPNTGDYLLNFPKSGKYKLLVEAQSSDRVHSGMVDIPAGDGISAYLQEMELIAPSGIEKLIINNKFDQKYQGDLAALVQEMLRKRAELEINFDASSVPEPVVVAVPPTADVAMAYNAAGFGAGMSNEAVVENAQKRVANMEQLAAEIAEKRDVASSEALQAYVEATDHFKNAKRLAAIDPASDGGKAAFEATVAQWEAAKAMERSRVAAELQQVLSAKTIDLEAKAFAEKESVTALSNDTRSGDYDTALEALKREHENVKNLDRVAAATDMLSEINLVGKKAREEADRAMSRATAMRAETESLSASRSTKQRQIEGAKGKTASELKADIARLDTDIADMESSTNRAYAQARDKEVLAARMAAQAQLLQSINKNEVVLKNGATGVNAPDGGQLKALADNIGRIGTDKEAAQNYSSKNPQALAALGSGNELRDFQRVTGMAETGYVELAAANLVDQPANVVAAAQPDHSATKSPTIKPAVPLTAPASQAGIVEEVASNEEVTKKEPTSIVPEVVQKSDATKAEKAPILTPSAAAPAIVQASQASESSPRNNETPIVATTPSPVATIPAPKTDEPRPTSETVPDPVTTLANELKNKPIPTGAAAIAQEINEQQGLVGAASDWLAIIDESIATLSVDAGGNDEDEQLANYQRLKAQKLDEISARENRIEALLEASGATKTTEVDAVAKAAEDVATLDPFFLTRLESKINEASSTPAYVNDIKQVDPTYVDELAAVERSGNSAPEMAAERIALNESLIGAIASKMQEPPSSKLPVERLVELRRIKVLEIQEDEKVREGSLPFVPRSAEAVAYAQMLAETPKDKATQDAPAEPESLLSPELRTSLTKPYSQDDAVPGYTEMMAVEVNEDSGIEFLSKRVEAHKTVLRSLKEEIDLYALLSSGADADDDPRIRKRYDQLLSQRSSTADVLISDRALLAKAAAATDATAESGMAQLKVSTATAPALSVDSGAKIPTLNANQLTRSVDEIIESSARELEEEYEQISTSNAPAGARLEYLARLNAESAQQISLRIDDLAQLLDDARSDADRDLIQIEIQKLDAVLADRLQEADRLSTEAETAQMVPTEPIAKVQSEVPSVITEGDEEEAIDLYQMQVAAASPIVLEEFAFKSLQANISGSRLEGAAALSAAKREEAREQLKVYQDASTPQQRSEAYRNFQRISDEITKADLELNKTVQAANEAEVAFYILDSKSLLESAEVAAKNQREREQLKAFEKRIQQINSEVEQNRERRDELDAFNTRAYSELLKEEHALLRQLEKVHTELETFTTELELAVAAAQATDREAEITTQLEQAKAEELAAMNKPEKAIGEVPAKQTVPEAPVSADADGQAEAPDAAIIEKEVARDDPSWHEPMRGNKYLTPAIAQAEPSLSTVHRKMFIDSEPVLSGNLDFASAKTTAERVELLRKMTRIDPQGLQLISEAEGQLRYLSSAVLTDSLKKLETAHAVLTERNYAEGHERAREAERLRGLVASEPSPKAKQQLEERAARIASEAEVSYGRAAIAASRADVIRLKRQEQEAELAQATQALDASQLASLNQLITAKPYTVVSSDLSTTELALAPSAKVPGTPKDSGAAVAKVAPAQSPAAPETPTPDTGAGNWLSMVEIIAERTTFEDVKETMFVMADRSVYTTARPIPVDPEMPSGLVFQVQIGAFRNAIPQDLFGEITPIIGQKLANGITRYRAGLFKEYQRAIEARDVIRAKGFQDAFVVAYVDGEHLTGEQARSILAQAAASSGPLQQAPAKAPVTQPKDGEQLPTSPPTPAAVAPTPSAKAPALAETSLIARPDYYNDPEAAQAVQVEVVQGLFYTVQVGVYSKPVKLDQLHNLNNLNSELTDKGLIRYTTGRYTSVGTASQGKQEAITAGVTDAFVTAYFNGRRIALTEAATLVEREGQGILSRTISDDANRPLPPANSGQKDKTSYVVVMGQFTDDVPEEIANFFLERNDLQIRMISGPQGQAIYVSPEFELLADAEDFLIEIRLAGLTGLLGTMVNGQIKELETK